MRVLMIIFVILYVLSPIDFYPGMLDDVILILINAMLQRKTSKA